MRKIGIALLLVSVFLSGYFILACVGVIETGYMNFIPVIIGFLGLLFMSCGVLLLLPVTRRKYDSEEERSACIQIIANSKKKE